MTNVIGKMVEMIKGNKESSIEADSIYKKEFNNNFSESIDDLTNYYIKVIYFQKEFYFIGYTLNNNKLGRENPNLEYL